MYVLLLARFLLLIKSVDFFVEGSFSVAKFLWVSAVIIDLITVAFGTSAPGLTVSTSASLSGSSDIAVGNVIGPNIFNLPTVMGACDVIMPTAIGRMILYRDHLFSILAAAVMLALSAFDHTLSRLNGMVPLLLFAYFSHKMVRNTLASRAVGGPKKGGVEVLSLVKSVLFILGGLATTVAGDNMAVGPASSTASSPGLSETLISLIVVVFGTSLPELVTPAMASREDGSGLTPGNTIRSSLSNILFVLITSTTISPMKAGILSTCDAIFLIAVSIITWFSVKSRLEMNRREGIVMVLVCVGYTAYIATR